MAAMTMLVLVMGGFAISAALGAAMFAGSRFGNPSDSGSM
jgi:hypothetical protein